MLGTAGCFIYFRDRPTVIQSFFLFVNLFLIRRFLYSWSIFISFVNCFIILDLFFNSYIFLRFFLFIVLKIKNLCVDFLASSNYLILVKLTSLAPCSPCRCGHIEMNRNLVQLMYKYKRHETNSRSSFNVNSDSIMGIFCV